MFLIPLAAYVKLLETWSHSTLCSDSNFDPMLWLFSASLVSHLWSSKHVKEHVNVWLSDLSQRDKNDIRAYLTIVSFWEIASTVSCCPPEFNLPFRAVSEDVWAQSSMALSQRWSTVSPEWCIKTPSTVLLWVRLPIASKSLLHECLSVCVCVCVCVYMCKCILACVCVCACVCICVCVYVCSCLHVFAYICVCVRACVLI